MKFILIFGPQAVGKMTVGQELAKITGLKLFHNHMTIDLVNPFFNFGSETGKRLVNTFRNEIFKAVAVSELEGLIFTYIWAFDQKEDWDYVENICGIFESKGGSTYFVELECDLDTRLERNQTENRLKFKPSKRDTNWSDLELRNSITKYRMNSEIDEIKNKNYIRINNSKLSAEKTALIIKQNFNL